MIALSWRLPHKEGPLILKNEENPGRLLTTPPPNTVSNLDSFLRGDLKKRGGRGDS